MRRHLYNEVTVVLRHVQGGDIRDHKTSQKKIQKALTEARRADRKCSGDKMPQR